MTEPASKSAKYQNIWAPWRVEYMEALGGPETGCFLCHHRDDKDNDEQNLVLCRGERAFVVMNRFPYTGGHSMVAPYEHLGELEDMDEATMLEIIKLVRDVQAVLKRAIHAQGFNIGINLGRCAGAGLPGHLHVHIVPRWSGDTNFMPVLDNIHVIPQALADLHKQLRQAAIELKLAQWTR